jgi:hypothetical protein
MTVPLQKKDPFERFRDLEKFPDDKKKDPTDRFTDHYTDHLAKDYRTQAPIEMTSVDLGNWAAEDDADKRFSNALARDNNEMIEKDLIAAAVNPSHHKGFIDDLQWIDVMSRIPRYRNNPEAFKGAVELQIRKYLDRNGRKDNELQELLKGLWYYKYLCAYIKNGCKPIRGDDVERILAK